MSQLSLTLLSLFSLILLSFTPSFVSSQTTPHIDSVFQGRCYDKSPSTNCTQWWEAFSVAVLNKDPLLVTPADYDDYFNIANFTTPVDKAMFWSGSNQVAHQLSDAGLRFFTMEDTVAGYTQNNLVWCGSATTPGFNYTYCPWGTLNTTTGDYSGAQPAFWQRASTTFARNAKGRASVLLAAANGRPAFRNDSFFALYELPNINTAQVTGIDLLVITNGTEACGQGSLAVLQNLVFTTHGIVPTCTDDPTSVRLILCQSSPTSPQCQLAIANENSTEFPVDKTVPIIISCVIGGILIGLLIHFLVVKGTCSSNGKTVN